MNAPSTACSVSPDVPGHSSRGRLCPQCNGPVERARRRILDRLVSWIMPVHRYRCRMKGWVAIGKGIYARSGMLCRCEGCGESYDGRHGALLDPSRRGVAPPYRPGTQPMVSRVIGITPAIQ